jgi:hypothetical protein
VEVFLKLPNCRTSILGQILTLSQSQRKPLESLEKIEVSVMGRMLTKVRLVHFFGGRCYKTLFSATWKFTKFSNVVEKT